MQRVVKVVVFGAGNKLLQGTRPVPCQGERLDISDGVGRSGRTDDHRNVSGDEDTEGQEKVLLRKAKVSHALVLSVKAARRLT